MQRIWVTLLSSIIILCGAFPAIASQHLVRISTGEGSFTIETERMRATFEDGVIAGLTNLKTGEVHAHPSLNDLGMPRGMGHLRGGIKHMERLHTPWHVRSMVLADEDDIVERPDERDEPIYFRPYEGSTFSTREIDNGIEATWTGLTNGEEILADEELTIRAWIDTVTGHLLFQSSARSTEKGVFGVQTPLANLADYHRFYVPSFAGVMLNRQSRTGLLTFRGFGNFLEARVLGIEGEQGSVGLWAQDDEFYNHYLFYNWSGRSFSVAFEHLNLMPFEDHDRTESVVYHLGVFDGNWVDAMTPYRDWYRDLFAEEMAIRADVSWADRIRIIIDSFSRSEAVYEKVAEMFEPDTVLFHDWNARKPGFDNGLPDWTPRDGYAELVRQIQSLGMRTMAYVNTYCVNYNSPVFKRDNIDSFGLTRKMSISSYARRRLNEDQQSQWEGFRDGQLLYLDPLSAEWRTYHTDMMIEWNKVTNTDANYEDVLGTARDTGNGIIDGLFAGQGAVAQVQDLLRRNPTVPMASEYAPENVAFGVRWPLSYLTVWGSTDTRKFWAQRTRPVSAYIHGPRLRPWVPILRAQDDLRRHWVMAWSDGYGGLAQLRASAVDLNATKGALALLNYRAQTFASLQLEPSFDTTRNDDDLAALYKDKHDEIYRYHVTDTVQEMIGPGDDPLYQRVHGVESFRSPLPLPGWPAYRDDKLLGLNPDTYYGLMPNLHNVETRIRITDLPEGIMVRRYYDRDNLSVVALERIDENSPETGSVELFTNAPMNHLLLNDEVVEAPVWNDAADRSEVVNYDTSFPAYFVFIRDDVAKTQHGHVKADQREQGLHIIPDVGIDIGVTYNVTHQRQWEVPNVGGTGEAGKETFHRTSGLEEVTLDYLVKVPDSNTSLLLYMNNVQHVYGNGAIARLYVNGRMVRAYDFGAIRNPDWESGMDRAERNLWPDDNVHMWKVPLGHLAGRPVLISIGTDYKKETNADNFWWSKPILLDDPDQKAAFVTLTNEGKAPEESFRVLPADFVVEEGRSHSPGGY